MGSRFWRVDLIGEKEMMVFKIDKKRAKMYIFPQKERKMQQTSLLAYTELLKSDHIGNKTKEYLSALRNFGSEGASDREVRDIFLHMWELGTISARRNDAIEADWVEEGETKYCQKTGRRVNTWRIKE